MQQTAVVTGGAGFIGANLTNRLLNKGYRVTVFDNLSRLGCQSNIAWLRQNVNASQLSVVQADLADFSALQTAVKGAACIYHLAGQVAVTTSIENPRQDFESNAVGTFNVLEAARLVGNDPIVIYASTNKVYGGMEDVKIVEEQTRYRYADFPYGIPETQSIDFHSPYGCSKGAGDQYMRDYHRIYALRTVVARQSCIYGYRQFGIEDQGWLAWFTIAVLKGRPISIYGNGKQVRDALFVEDLLDAYDAFVQNIDTAAGQVYNIGGGPDKTLSIWAEFGPMLEEFVGHEIPVTYKEWRAGDQPVYISDIRKAENDLRWRPQVSIHEGARRMFEWIRENQMLFTHL